MPATPERFLWAAELMHIKPDQHILEIGCGAGLLAEQIAAALGKGQLTAIDRSEPMLGKARKRNQAYIDKGTVVLQQGDFARIELPKFFFDSIVAFNVNFFWKEEAKEWALVRKALKREGRLYVLYQLPFDITIESAQPIVRNLEKHHFKVLETLLQSFSPTAACCIIAGRGTQ